MDIEADIKTAARKAMEDLKAMRTKKDRHQVLRINPDGTIDSLYRDETRGVMEAVGRIDASTRASDIRFDSADGLWYIHEIKGDLEIKHTPGFRMRESAIEAERVMLENQL
jgi:hypothetical protein